MAVEGLLLQYHKILRELLSQLNPGEDSQDVAHRTLFIKFNSSPLSLLKIGLCGRLTLQSMAFEEKLRIVAYT
uniref:Uncharacterized protein n=1 Tax=Utricularia reniformis TaxID=192314 RepID=A0A1Y0B3L5_9LAMI|nr:hypothetical protein AEK19_MT1813 [Utricularia reniformis]ART31984.1 hypothetical protein AEK19_MT1813 [Utricularia reniformis]